MLGQVSTSCSNMAEIRFIRGENNARVNGRGRDDAVVVAPKIGVSGRHGLLG